MSGFVDEEVMVGGLSQIPWWLPVGIIVLVALGLILIIKWNTRHVSDGSQ